VRIDEAVRRYWMMAPQVPFSHDRPAQQSVLVVHVWPYSEQPCGAPHVPVVEPPGITHGRPMQQSVFVVHAAPCWTHAPPQ